MLARTFAVLVIFAFECIVEDVADERTLTRAADARYDCHYIEGELDVDTLEVVVAGTAHLDVIVPRTACGGNGYRFFIQKVAYSVALGPGLQVVHIALVYYLPTETTCVGAYIDNVIGCTDDIFVVLYHYDRVAGLLQLAEYTDELVGIAAMQTYGGLVEDVE
jgi:hypothetical protein